MKRIKCGDCEMFAANKYGAYGIGNCKLGRHKVQRQKVKTERGLFYIWEYPMYPNSKRFCKAFIGKDFAKRK